MERVSNFWKDFVDFVISPIVLFLAFCFLLGLSVHYSSQKKLERQGELRKTKAHIEQVIYRSCDLQRIIKEGKKLKEGKSKLFLFTEFCKPAKVKYNGKNYNLLLLYKVAGVKVKKVDHGVLLLTPAYIGKDFDSWKEELEKLTGKYIPLPTVKEILLDSDLVKNPKVVISDSFEVVK